MNKDDTPHNHTYGILTTHHTGGSRVTHSAVTGVFFPRKFMAGSFFLFFAQTKMRESLVTHEKRVKSNDKNDKRVLSI